MIFGYKQNGANALETDNLFHPNSYENGVNIDSIADPYQKRAIRDQINEYGQTPKQLFYSPHPRRRIAGMMMKELPLKELEIVPEPPKKQVLSETGESQGQQNAQSATQKKPARKIDFEYLIDKSGKIELNEPTAFVCRNDGREIVACESRFLKSFTLDGSAFPTKIYTVGNSQISAIEAMSQNKYAIGNVDGEVFLYDYSFGVVNTGFSAHFNTVTALCNLPNLVF